MKYNRVLLKLSGEALMGSQQYGIDPQRLNDYADEIIEAAKAGVQIGIVIGGGNIYRGLQGASKGMDRIQGDYMGAIRLLEEGHIVVMGAGTGNPFFTTDTGSALRAVEIKADIILKGTRVDGIYTADPEKDPTATKFEHITYDEAYQRNLKVMDMTAFTMCKENDMPMYVFDMNTRGNLMKVLRGENIGTFVTK